MSERVYRSREELERRRRDFRERSCVHFNGYPLPVRDDGAERRCGAGISYVELAGGSSLFSLRHLPCCPTEGRNGVVYCERFEANGRERVIEEDRLREERWARTNKARAHIVAEIAGTDALGGEIPCPNCGGRLAFRVGDGHHLRGRCATEGCCSWIE